MKRITLLGLALATTLLFLGACKNATETGDTNSVWQTSNKVKVVCTTTMITDMVKSIAGDKAEVKGLMNHKIDPHGYVETRSDITAMNTADVIFYNGLHLEAKMQKGLEHKAKKGEKVVALADAVPAEKLLNDEGERDPHIWGDPEIWLKTVDLVLETFVAADGANKESYEKNAAAYRLELIELHDWAKSRVAEIPEQQRILVTSHDAFQYFAKAYGFEVKGLQGLSSDEEVGTGAAMKLIDYIKSKGVKTIFAEFTTNEKGIVTVAKEAGVQVNDSPLYADSCGPLGQIEEAKGEQYDVGTYVGMIKYNVNSIVEALK